MRSYGAEGAAALTAWYSTVLQLRGQLSAWLTPQATLSLQMDKQSRHVQVRGDGRVERG